MKNLKKIIAIIFISLVVAPFTVSAQPLVERVKGKILLRVEGKGEAWYVNPSDGRRYFMGKPQEAFNLMKRFGVGITDRDLFQIPLAEGYFDVTASPINGNGCRIPCTGAAPSETVERNCRELLIQEQCSLYKSDEFPYRCEWLPTNYQCPPIP